MTGLIINPGSRIGEPGDGWTNTYATARTMAEDWLAKMRAEGLTDVTLLDGGEDHGDGRWGFMFRHEVTGVSICLDTHGIDNPGAYQRQHPFTPRIYWNGSSCSNPELEDFAAPGFAPVRTFTTETENAITAGMRAERAHG